MATELATEKAIKQALRELTAEEKQEVLDSSTGRGTGKGNFYTLLDPFTSGHCAYNGVTIRGGIVDALEQGLDTVEKYEAWMSEVD